DWELDPAVREGIEGIEKDSPYRFHGNVPNSWRGAGPAISNLPHDGIVEVHCTADGHGIHPGIFGRLPVPMAGICASHMYCYEQAATAAIERSKEAAIQALMLDPLTAACCTPRQIRQLAEEMFAAEAEFLPGFA
ncbi:MAG: alpha-glucosidase/alpha-galactosidase, partial [Planctomycetota bacterium]